MKIIFESKVEKKLIKIGHRNRRLLEKINEAIVLFKKEPKYPSLRLHKIRGKKNDVWSISVEADLRIIFIYIKDGILLIDIGSHDEVY